MLDRDLAQLYGVETKSRQKNNQHGVFLRIYIQLSQVFLSPNLTNKTNN